MGCVKKTKNKKPKKKKTKKKKKKPKKKKNNKKTTKTKTKKNLTKYLDPTFQKVKLFCFREKYTEMSITFKGTNGRQKTYEIFHVYWVFYSGFMCQTTVIFGITKDGSLVLTTLAS